MRALPTSIYRTHIQLRVPTNSIITTIILSRNQRELLLLNLTGQTSIDFKWNRLFNISVDGLKY